MFQSKTKIKLRNIANEKSGYLADAKISCKENKYNNKN